MSLWLPVQLSLPMSWLASCKGGCPWLLNDFEKMKKKALSSLSFSSIRLAICSVGACWAVTIFWFIFEKGPGEAIQNRIMYSLRCNSIFDFLMNWLHCQNSKILTSSPGADTDSESFLEIELWLPCMRTTKSGQMWLNSKQVRLWELMATWFKTLPSACSM